MYGNHAPLPASTRTGMIRLRTDASMGIGTFTFCFWVKVHSGQVVARMLHHTLERHLRVRDRSEQHDSQGRASTQRRYAMKLARCQLIQLHRNRTQTLRNRMGLDQSFDKNPLKNGRVHHFAGSHRECHSAILLIK